MPNTHRPRMVNNQGYDFWLQRMLNGNAIKDWRQCWIITDIAAESLSVKAPILLLDPNSSVSTSTLKQIRRRKLQQGLGSSLLRFDGWRILPGVIPLVATARLLSLKPRQWPRFFAFITCELLCRVRVLLFRFTVHEYRRGNIDRETWYEKKRVPKGHQTNTVSRCPRTDRRRRCAL